MNLLKVANNSSEAIAAKDSDFTLVPEILVKHRGLVESINVVHEYFGTLHRHTQQ